MSKYINKSIRSIDVFIFFVVSGYSGYSAKFMFLELSKENN